MPRPPAFTLRLLVCPVCGVEFTIRATTTEVGTLWTPCANPDCSKLLRVKIDGEHIKVDAV